MSRTSTTLKRLGVGAVTVGTVFAMPYVGVVSAFAAAPGVAPTPSDVTITSQVSGNASPRNDGTNTTVKVSANVAYAPATGGASNAAAPGSVRFTYRPAGGATDVLIGTDTTAPYSVEWTPPAGGGTGYTLFAEALDSSGNSYATPAKSAARTTSVTDAASVHITSPAEGGNAGYYAGNGNTITVSGTRSSDLPEIDLYTQVRDNSTGTLSPANITLGTFQGKVNAGTPAAGADQTWSGTATIAGPIPTDADVVITAVAVGSGVNGTSDEVTEAKLVKQTLSGFTVAPASATKPAGASQDYIVTATDQNGNGIAGLQVTGSSNNTGVATISPAQQNTGAGGTAKFTAQSTTTPGTATFTFQTNLDTAFPGPGGSHYNQAADFSRTATLTTYTSNPTSATLTATPAKALYASNPNSAEYNGTFPAVTLCVVDQNGNGTPAGTGGTPVVTDTRTDSNTPAGTTPAAQPVTVTAQAGTNCYTVNYPPATGAYGTDVIKAYFENNGTPGYQAGSTDVAAPDLTLKYATLSITGLATQAQKGTATTVSFKVLGADGSPFANRKITLTSTSSTGKGGFTPTQPTGTTAPTSAAPNTVVATTDANGVASATVNSPANTTGAPAADDTVTVSAKDDITDTNQKATNATSSPNSVVSFRDKSVALTTLTESGQTLISPAGSANNTVTIANPAGTPRPGDVEQVTYTLTDANGEALANTSVALTLDHGFFTPNCAAPAVNNNPEQYANCTFNTAPADGAAVGNLKSLGATQTLTTDPTGKVTFSVAMARDEALDATGSVDAALSAVANGGTAKDTSVVTFTTKGLQPINGGTVKLVPAGTTTALSGDVPSQTYNTGGSLTANPVTFAVQVTDQYGNLVQLPTNDVQLTATGGTLSAATAHGSYADNAETFTLTSTTTSTSGAPATVTATWNAPVTQFKGTVTGVAPNQTTKYTTVAGTAVKKTDSFTVNFYAIDLQHLAFTFASTPSNSVPVNTAVTTSVTAKDQKGNPVQNLCVNFVRSGPNDAAGNSQTGGTTQFGCVRTNAAGKAGTTYSSGTPGTATVTGIVTDNSGNELSRGVQTVTFTAGGSNNSTKPTITIDRTAMNVGQSAIITLKGTPGDSVQFFQRVQPATTFSVFRTFTFNANGVVTINSFPRTNTAYFARTAAGDSSIVTLSVRPAVSLRGTAANRLASFNGVIVPGHGGVKVRIFVVKNGVVGALVATATTNAQGHYTASHQFAGHGRVTFIAQTISDSIALAGQSNRLTLTI